MPADPLLGRREHGLVPRWNSRYRHDRDHEGTGSHTLTYYSTDAVGNTESVHP